MKTVYCGLLRREPDGWWYFGNDRIGKDGEPFDGVLEDAVLAFSAAKAQTPAVCPPRAPPVQMCFDWPVEEQRLPVDEKETLFHAHRQVFAQLDAGTWCPCCQRPAKRQPRTIHGEMLEFLVKLVRAWLVVKRWYTMVELMPETAAAPKHASDASYFVPWGLLKRRAGHRGQYQPEQVGVAFVLGRTTVPKVAHVYDARATHFSKEMVSIREAIETVKSEEKREMLEQLVREIMRDHGR